MADLSASDIRSLYSRYQGREPRPDEVDFHLKGKTPLEKLKPWLLETGINKYQGDIARETELANKRSLGSYDLESKLLQKMRQDKALQQAKQSYYTAPEDVRANPEYASMTPQQRAQLAAQRQAGYATEVQSRGGALKDILANISNAYAKGTEQMKTGLEGKKTLLQLLLDEQKQEEDKRRWQMEYALQAARLGQSGGGGYGGYGSSILGDLSPELLRAFELDIDANLEGRADNPLPYETLVAGYAADSNLSEADRSRLIQYATNRKAQLAGEQTQNTPTGNWFSNTFGSMGRGMPQNSYTQYLATQRVQKPTWGVQSSRGDDTSGNTTVPGSAYRGW